jgi:hypothetical protein
LTKKGDFNDKEAAKGTTMYRLKARRKKVQGKGFKPYFTSKTNKEIEVKCSHLDVYCNLLVKENKYKL